MAAKILPLLTHFPLDNMAAILADNIFRCIFMNEKFCILIEISLKFVPKGTISNIPALVRKMEPMLTWLTDAYNSRVSCQKGPTRHAHALLPGYPPYASLDLNELKADIKKSNTQL